MGKKSRRKNKNSNNYGSAQQVGRTAAFPSPPPSPSQSPASSPSQSPAKSAAAKTPPLPPFAGRPGMGSFGSSLLVKANHFMVEFPHAFIFFRYEVSITSDLKSRKVDSKVDSVVIRQLVKELKKEDASLKRPFYDGETSLYSTRAITSDSKEYNITLPNAVGSNDSDLRVTISFKAKSSANDLNMGTLKGQSDPSPDVIRFLESILRQSVKTSNPNFYSIGSSFFNPDSKHPLGDGLETFLSFYQSISPNQNGFYLNVNLNVSSTVFIKPIQVLDFLAEVLNKDVLDRNYSLAASDLAKVRKRLKGVEVEVTHTKEKCRISSITDQPTLELSLPSDEEGRKESVADYFKRNFQQELKYTHLPCLVVGNSDSHHYLPIEVCRIVEGQKYTEKLNEKQNTELLKVTCESPQNREKGIREVVENNSYENDPYAAQTFGIKINKDLVLVDARVLSPPRLQYGVGSAIEIFDPEDTAQTRVEHRVEQWGCMYGQKVYYSSTVRSWTCINFEPNLKGEMAENFCYDLAQMCITLGMDYKFDPVMRVSLSHPDDDVEAILKETSENVKKRVSSGENLDMLIAILPDNSGPLYGDVKRICETELGIVSLCCLRKDVYNSNLQLLENLALKINVKFGGQNTVLARFCEQKLPTVISERTMIFGADVIHPQPGDSAPSVAAVVASKDYPKISRYAAKCSAQRQGLEEITDLCTMISELLGFRKPKNLPKRIIFYRNGDAVSKANFCKVMSSELDAIRKALTSLNPGYKPKVTFVVVQTGHNSRLFANDHTVKATVDSSGNILAGTIVDSKICHPREFDFYLCSHAGIQGTSCPAHYRVLWDDNKFSADDVQSLTNNLCYTHAWCTHAVSIVPPVSYARLAASRARVYMESDAVRDPGARGDNDFPQLKEPMEKVQRGMYFC